MTAFTNVNLWAQPACQTDLVVVDFPSEYGSPPKLEICDLEFSATITITHTYSTSHDYTVTFAFDPDYISFAGTEPALSNVSFGQDIFGNTLVTGTYTAPSDGEVTLAELQVRFNRLNYWQGNDEGVTFTVSDASCDPSLQLDYFRFFTVEPHTDLRSVAETRLSELLDDGIVVLLPGNSSLPNMLIDELVIDVPASFIGSVNSFRDVTLMPGASIRIATDNPGSGLTANLFVTETNIHTCPGMELAEGIVTDPQNTVGFPLTKLYMRNSVISDCRFGVNARPNSSFRLEDNQFVNNYIGVNLDMSGAAAGQERVRIDGFAGNTFLTDGELKQPYSGMPEEVETRGFCGIRLINYRDFNVFGNSSSGGNEFSALANGIVGYNAIGNIGNMTFSDMNSADAQAKYPNEGFGIRLVSKGVSWFNINEFWTTMTFEDCKTGIYAANYAFNVENVQMDNVGTGIDCSKSQLKDIVLAGNTITAREYGIRSFGNEPVHSISAIRDNIITITGQGAGVNAVSGIRMEELGLGFTPLPGQTVPQAAGTDGWEVSNNEVTMQLGGNGILYRNGVSGLLESNTVNDEGQTNDPGPYDGIFLDGTMFSQVNFNDVTRSTTAGGNATNRAIHSKAGFANAFTCNCVDNTGVGVQFFDMADFSGNVRGNKFNDHDETGLQMGDENIGNAYIGVQYHTGNEWCLGCIPSGGYGGVHWGSVPQIIALSMFFVDPDEKNGALDPPVDPEEGWFDEDPTTPSSFECENSCSAPTEKPPFEPESDVPTRLDMVIAIDSLPADTWEDEMKWKGAYRLYRKMLRRPAIENYSQEFEDFKAANDSLSTGKLAYIAEEKARIFSLSAPEDSILENYRLAWHTEMEELKTLDSLRHAGDTTVSHAQYDTAVQHSITALTQYEQYAEELAETRKEKIEDLLALNNAVATSLAPAANHKAVNDIVLKMLLTDTLASGDLDALDAIAGQCPFEGGDAVYEARAIVACYTGQEYDDYELCESSEREQKIRNEPPTDLEEGVIIYPSPTSGEVFLSVSGEILVRVFNDLGQLQLEKVVTDNRLNLSQLQPGLYRFQLFRNGQMLTTQSVVLFNR